MKHLFFFVFIAFLSGSFTGISQTKKDSIEAVKQKLLLNIYANEDEQDIIRDKSFVSENRLYHGHLNNSSRPYITDKDLIKKTLQDYIEGSSYNKLDMLKNVFAENATLYLTIKEEFKVITPEEYTTFFKEEPNSFNGRKGKVLSIDIAGDIAMAKAEISIPVRKWRFTDLFLLKKIGEDWKIISKTATRTVVKEER